MLLTVVLDMVEYLIVNDALVYVFYNLMDDIVICAFCIGINIIFSRLKYEELERKENLLSQSSKDPLTGLFNRRYLERYFEEHSDWHSRCAIIMMDLDNFKMANDTFGHRKGDEVLCRVSDILRKNFRETDCVARLGGDEFAVFIPEVSKTEVIMNRVKQVLQCFPIVIDGETRVEVSVSIGAVLKGNEIAPSYAELCSKADQAMYRAKKTGKAKAVVTNDERQEETII
jgi:diguanylate cyclase (GGDEF)-like protein